MKGKKSTAKNFMFVMLGISVVISITAIILVLGVIGKVVEQLRLQGENFPGHPRRESGLHFPYPYCAAPDRRARRGQDAGRSGRVRAAVLLLHLPE